MNSAGEPAPLFIHGWAVLAHPLFLAQIESLAQHRGTQTKGPSWVHAGDPSTRLAAITKLVFEIIQRDPTRPEYRQDSALSNDHKHWFRAKFFPAMICFIARGLQRMMRPHELERPVSEVLSPERALAVLCRIEAHRVVLPGGKPVTETPNIDVEG